MNITIKSNGIQIIDITEINQYIKGINLNNIGVDGILYYSTYTKNINIVYDFKLIKYKDNDIVLEIIQ